MKQIVIYSRKSKFTGKGESIENQIEMCRQYIRLHYGVEAADQAVVYEDEGFSGGNLERPQFKKMMEQLKEGAFQAVVVYRLDRISRNIGDFAGLIERLGELHVDFVSIKEQFDTSSPMGRAMMFISSVFSQLERETIAERIRDNMQELAKTGRWLGGTTPTGFCSKAYETVNADGRTKKACRLEGLPEELEIVKTVYQEFLRTGSLSGAEAALLTQGIRTKNGRAFSRFAVKAILSNPVYAKADEAVWQYFKSQGAEVFSEHGEFDGRHGVMAYNRSLQRPGKAHRDRPEKEWIVAVGGHEGLIEGETWVRVQEMLLRNGKKSYRRPKSHEALLSGLLYCGGCKSRMRPKGSGRKREDGTAMYSYLCINREKSRGALCQMKNPDGNRLDQAASESLSQLPEDVAAFCTYLETERKALLKEQRKRKAKKDGTREEKAGRQPETAAESVSGEPRLTAGELSSFPFVFRQMTPEEKREAFRSLTEQVIWDGETARIILKGAEREYL